MANPQIFGQTLHESLVVKLGGLSNAFDTNELLDFLNQSKDAVWSVLRSLGQEYFVDQTQAATSTADDFFQVLSTTVREYDLPPNTRELRMIECTTEGYKHLKFEQRSMSDRDFVEARNWASVQSSATGTGYSGTYLYAVVGRRKLMFAQFPEAALTLQIWRVVALDDLSLETELTEILHPFWRAIVDFAAMLANLSLTRTDMDAAWQNQWQLDVRLIAGSAVPRASTAPVFIDDYEGG